jgi:hypothetical protein
MYRVLSIDGGGIRGVIPAVLLDALETRSGKRISDLFDLIVGTSTGGILTAGLAVEGPGGTARYAAADMLELYATHGKTIFRRSFWDGVTSLGGLTEERYSAEPLEGLLEDYLGDATLQDVRKPVVITSYDIERRAPYFFKTVRADRPGRNHRLRDACRATSAAPTYFEPAEIFSLGDEPVRRALVDGGVFVNNPALCGFFEALKAGHGPEEILIASLGTGVATRPIPLKDAQGWGVTGWVKPVLSVMMDGQADAADYHLALLLPSEGDGQRYFRFDTDLDLALDDMDAAHAANIAALKAEAQQILDTQGAEFEQLLRVLAQSEGPDDGGPTVA